MEQDQRLRVEANSRQKRKLRREREENTRVDEAVRKYESSLRDSWQKRSFSPTEQSEATRVTDVGSRRFDLISKSSSERVEEAARKLSEAEVNENLKAKALASARKKVAKLAFTTNAAKRSRKRKEHENEGSREP